MKTKNIGFKNYLKSYLAKISKRDKNYIARELGIKLKTLQSYGRTKKSGRNMPAKKVIMFENIINNMDIKEGQKFGKLKSVAKIKKEYISKIDKGRYSNLIGLRITHTDIYTFLHGLKGKNIILEVRTYYSDNIGLTGSFLASHEKYNVELFRDFGEIFENFEYWYTVIYPRMRKIYDYELAKGSNCDWGIVITRVQQYDASNYRPFKLKRYEQEELNEAEFKTFLDQYWSGEEDIGL